MFQVPSRSEYFRSITSFNPNNHMRQVFLPCFKIKKFRQKWLSPELDFKFSFILQQISWIFPIFDANTYLFYWTFLFYSIQHSKPSLGAPRKHLWGERGMTDHVDTVQVSWNLCGVPGSDLIVKAAGSPSSPSSSGWIHRCPPDFKLLVGAELSAREPQGWGSAGTCQPTRTLPHGPWLWLQRNMAGWVRWEGRCLQGRDSFSKEIVSTYHGASEQGQVDHQGSIFQIHCPWDRSLSSCWEWVPHGSCPTSGVLCVSVENVMWLMEERWDRRVSTTPGGEGQLPSRLQACVGMVTCSNQGYITSWPPAQALHSLLALCRC